MSFYFTGQPARADPAMERQQLDLDFANNEIYECGAALVSVLVLPSKSDTRARSNLEASLCAEYLRDQYFNKDKENTPILVKPKYAFRAEADIRRDRKTLGRRLRDRMFAAHMAIALLQNAIGHKPKLPKGVRRLSLNELAAEAADKLDQADAGNVESRIWRPSVPVIHLAAAVAVAINNGERKGLPRTSIGDIVHDRKLIEEIVRDAAIYESIIINSKLPIKSAKLITVRIRLND
jgi:hypothetical protein